MYSEPARQSAMDKAILSNSAAITDPVILVQDDGEAHKEGFLIYLPVSRTDVS